MKIYVITGHAKSGKTTFGNILKEKLKEYGYKPCVMQITSPLYHYADEDLGCEYPASLAAFSAFPPLAFMFSTNAFCFPVSLSFAIPPPPLQRFFALSASIVTNPSQNIVKLLHKKAEQPKPLRVFICPCTANPACTPRTVPPAPRTCTPPA